MDDKMNGAAAPEQQAAAAAGDAAAAAATGTQPGQPTPEQIQAMVEGHKRVAACFTTLNFLTGQANQMLNMLCGGNTRLCLAISNELRLYYEEAIRRSVQVTPNTPENNTQAPAKDAQDNNPPEEKTA